MEKSIRVFFVLVLAAIFMRKIESSSDIMKQITSSFMKALEQCKQELNLSDHVIRDLYFYWKEDYTLLKRETGCAIVCMSHKLNLLDTSGKLHHGNAREFALSHGAGDETASKLVTAIHSCESQNAEVEDACIRALEVAKCFRTAIDQLNWSPKMDVIITEVLTEI